MIKHTGAMLRLAGALLGAVAVASCETTAPAGSAWALERSSGDGQLVEVGTQVPAPTVRVLVKGRPLANVAVQWSADADGSADRTTRTDANGLARGMWWVGAIPGQQHLTATLGALAEPVTFTATAVAGPMAHIYLRPEVGTLQNVRDSLQLLSAATDRLGNTIPIVAAAWTSLDPLTASVSSGGLVRGRTGGVARIVISSGMLTDTATITVSQPAGRVVVDPDTAYIAALTRGTQLRVLAWDEFGNTIYAPSVTWSSLTPAIASVDAHGFVTANANGTATILGRVGAVGGTGTVLVYQRATDLTVTPLFPRLFVDDSVRIAVAAYDAARKPMPQATLSFTSSDTTVATAAPDGWVRAIAAGTATIRIVASPGGALGQSVVTVSERP